MKHLLSTEKIQPPITRRAFLETTTIAGAGVMLKTAAGGISNVEVQRKPNIVYIFSDQQRAKATGYDGNPDVITPNLDKLAGESINFRNTISVCPVCTPYRASLMTGRYPTTTGMFLNDLHLPTNELCIPEIFRNAGYDTAYIGKWHLDGYGRDTYIPPERRQGWSYWKVAECDHNNHRSHYYTEASNERRYWEGYDAFAQTKDAQQYILDHSDTVKPFLLMVSYGPPHPASPEAPEAYSALYTQEQIALPPNVPRDKQAEARRHLHHYYAHCTAIDHCAGQLIQTIKDAGIEEDTIFVFTSDHGGMLLSHGLPYEWKQVAWDESARVPFLLRYPAVHANDGRVIETPLNTPDILPTLLGLANIPIPDTVEGEDLSTVIIEGTEIQNRAVLYMSIAPFVGQGEPYRALRTRQYTYVRSLEGPSHLFDDLQDPFQMNNLIGKAEYETLSQELDTELQKQLDIIGDDFRPPQSYIAKWGYHVDEEGAIPYRPPVEPQGPGLNAI